MGIDFAERNQAVEEKQFEKRIDILDSLNADFEHDYGTKDTRSYMDTYASSLKFMSSKDIDAFDLKRESERIVGMYGRMNSVAVACWPDAWSSGGFVS